MIGSSRVRVDSGLARARGTSESDEGRWWRRRLLLHLLHLLLLRLRLLLLPWLCATDATHCLPPTIHPYPATTDHVAPVRPLPLIALTRSSCPRQPPRRPLLLLLRLLLLLPSSSSPSPYSAPLMLLTGHWTVAKNPSLNRCKKHFSVETVAKKPRLSRKVATVWKSPCYCR